MKNIILLLVLFFVTISFSQNISVTTSTYTIQELVNNVLINTPCVLGTNITSRTGINFASSNGIGYFQNTNPNFPFQSGVILSTGSAVHASGPNDSLLDDGSSSWIGDTDLEATLAQSGITMTSANATVLEFDFTPISSHFSFDFVFASEEYGNFQCQFSDAFSFLLTNLTTGVTKNLAVVPGTTLPISVVTIRDYLYNSSCPSENAQYFGNYNGGSAANGSATNFNGQTVVMTASSVLIPNTPYHIKLVIADRNDFKSDSAIFLKSNSFNIGQNVLGEDLTVQNNGAICYGQPYTISTGLNPANYSFKWTNNGAVIQNETSPNLPILLPGIYSVTYNKLNSPCNAITNTITIEYLPELTVASPKNLYKCPSSSGSYVYQLASNNYVVLAGQVAGTIVKYFNTLSNATNNVNPIPATYPSNSNETIYVRVTNPITHCFSVKSFQLLIIPAPVANQPADLTACETNKTNHTASFTITNQTSSVLNGQSPADYSVIYYTTLADATLGTNSISTSSYTATNGTIIYVRIKNNSDASCFSVTSFTLFVKPKPEVDTLPNVLVCDNYVLPPLTNGNYFTATNGGGTPLFAGAIINQNKTIYIFNSNGSCSAETNFKIKIINLNTLTPGSKSYCDSYVLPSIDYASYYTLPDAGGNQLQPGDVISTTQTIYLYYVSLETPFCIVQSHFTVTINNSPLIPNFANVFECNSYTLPPLSIGKYFTAANGAGTELAAGSLITSTQKIYNCAATNTVPKCTSEASFIVTIGPAVISDVTECVSYTLPPLTVGNYYTGVNGTGTLLTAGTIIKTTQTIHVYVIAQDGCISDVSFLVTILLPIIEPVLDKISCTSYTLPTTVGNYYTGTNGTGTILNPGDVITNSIANMYIYVTNGAGCQNQQSFKITIKQLPPIDSRSDIDICDSYTLTNLTNGKYYTGTNGTGTELVAGTIITTTQTIYIYATSATAPFCSQENSFTIHIFSVQADAPANVNVCDSYTLPALINGKYYTKTGGQHGLGTLLLAGQTLTSTQTVYVYTESGQRINCSSENLFTVTIFHAPVIAAVKDTYACDSYALPVLAVGKYFTGTNGSGTELSAGTIITTTQTIYSYATLSTAPFCSQEKSFTIQILSVQADAPANVIVCDSYTLPAITNGKYYTKTGGQHGLGTLLLAGQTLTATQTVYVYNESGGPFNCSSENLFTVTINHAPVIAAVTDTYACNSYALPVLAVGKYFTGTNGSGTELLAGTIITTSQTIYSYATLATAPFCSQENNFTIHILSVQADAPANVIACDSYTLPALTNGTYYTKAGGPHGTGTLLLAGQTITATQTIYVYNESGLSISCPIENSFTVSINHSPVIAPVADIIACDSYTLPTLAVGNYFTQAGGFGTMLQAGDLITNEQTIYIYAYNATSRNCTSEKKFKIKLLKASTLPNVTSCNYTLPNIAIGNYYTGPNATGTTLPVGTVINTTQKIYIHATSPLFPSCFSENSFLVTIVNQPKVNDIPLANRSICDTDGTNDGITPFDLTSLNAIALGNQSPSQFSIAYFENNTDAITNSNAIVTTTQKTIYVRVTNIASGNTCYDIKAITLIVNKRPVPNPKSGFICINNQTGTVLNPYTINSELSSNDNAFVWTNENNTIVGNNSVLQVSTKGTYSLIVRDTRTGCVSLPQQVAVDYSQIAVVKYTKNDSFSDNQSITVTAIGSGEYEYQLDDTNFQVENVFQNLSAGSHTIIVHDKNGCGDYKLDFFILNYPKFFTPNGDGQNETWNIYSLEQPTKSKIIIFDRFGKVLKALSMGEKGWDGTYNGHAVPSDDYWFTISYLEDGVTKEFKSHFSLVR